MGQFERFSTVGLDPRRKLQYWNEFVSDRGSPIISDPIDVWSFNASVAHTQIDTLRLAEVYTDPQVAQHSQAHVARSEALFFLHMQLKGSCHLKQGGRDALLQPGDFALSDTTRPYELIFNESNRALVLGIPEEVMHRYLGSPESVVAIRMSGSSGMSALASDFLRAFWKRLREDLHPSMAPQLLNTALELIANVYSAVPQAPVPRSALAAAHRARILNYIEAHLSDSELTPTVIAKASKITIRYLHHLFAGAGETVARYIMRRRLEECAKALGSRVHHGHTVTTIAFGYGFSSLTHFGRAFRAHFGTTPREYRRERVATHSANERITNAV